MLSGSQGIIVIGVPLRRGSRRRTSGRDMGTSNTAQGVQLFLALAWMAERDSPDAEPGCGHQVCLHVIDKNRLSRIQIVLLQQMPIYGRLRFAEVHPAGDDPAQKNLPERV